MGKTEMEMGRGGRADNFRGFLAAGVHTRQARDLLSLPGTLGFKMARARQLLQENPNPGAIQSDQKKAIKLWLDFQKQKRES